MIDRRCSICKNKIDRYRWVSISEMFEIPIDASGGGIHRETSLNACSLECVITWAQTRNNPDVPGEDLAPKGAG